MATTCSALVQRRDAISRLLANTSAVARELSGLVADNQSKLAPTLDKLNAVTAVLEKNRDNIAKTLPGLKKFEITSGETVANGFYYNAFVPNLQYPNWSSRFWTITSASAAADPTCHGHCSPGRTMAFREVRGDRQEAACRDDSSGPGGPDRGAAALLVRETFLRPMTITGYFTSATGIYPGDDIRVSGVKVGTVSSIQPMPSQAKLTLEVDRDVPIPADAKAVIVSQNLVAARYVQLTPAYTRPDPICATGP